MPKKARPRKAVLALREFCVAKRADRKDHYDQFGQHRQKTLLEVQMAYFEHWFNERQRGTGPFQLAARFFTNEPRFRTVVREAFIRRNRKGISYSFTRLEHFSIYHELNNLIDRKNVGAGDVAVNALLDSPRLREELIESIAHGVSHYSTPRYQNMTTQAISIFSLKE